LIVKNYIFSKLNIKISLSVDAKNLKRYFYEKREKFNWNFLRFRVNIKYKHLFRYI